MAKEGEQAPRDGYYRVLTVGATPVYVRLDAVIFLGVCAVLLLLGLRATPAAIGTWILLLTVHEVAHAVAARAFGGKVTGVFIHLVGGRCTFLPPPRHWQTAIAYGAGIMAQFLILVAALAWLALRGVPGDFAGFGALAVLSAGNAYLIGASLMPRTYDGGMRSDGLLLWQLYLHAYRGGPPPFPRRAVPAEEAPVFDPAISLLTMPELVPQGFVTGIALYNDAKTPMDFVIRVLMGHLALERDEATRLMLDIHNKGGSLVPLTSRARAEEIAGAIMADAIYAGHPFTCCAVEVGGSMRRIGEA